MINDQDILEENRQVLRRRHRLLVGSKAVDVARLGLSPEAAVELKSLDPIQVDRAADAVSPLFGFDLEDQIIRLLEDPPLVHLSPPSVFESEMLDDATLLLVNRWTSCRQSPSFSGTVLGMSRRLISVLASATYLDVKRVAAQGVRPSLCVRPQYLFHAGRNIVLQRSQRTNMAVCNTRFNAF